MKIRSQHLFAFLLAVAGTWVSTPPASARPLPTGSSTTTVSYDTAAGPQSFSETINYAGQSMGDAVPLPGAPNISSFNSVNSFGRRMFLESGGVDVINDATESLVTHAFFKLGVGDDYFPGIVAGGNVTIDVASITFDQPVFVDESTMMLHALWKDSQVQGLTNGYFNLHNHHTLAAPFRDFGSFFPSVFLDVPVANYTLDDPLLDVTVTGNGTNQLDLSATFSYDILEHLEEVALNLNPNPEDVAGLPAPQGFLEPFHFHLEYVVTPEPSSLALLLPAIWAIRARRRLR